jgi:tRNA(fMet)-specific endonuclease VapC
VKYVLDTNSVSALMRAEPATIARLRKTNRRDVAIPHPVIAEISYGIVRLVGSKRRSLLEERFAMIVDTLPRVDWTDAVSAAFGEAKASLEKRGLRIEDFDVAIAAHALSTDATLVSGNVKHMRNIDGLALEDWSVER